MKRYNLQLSRTSLTDLFNRIRGSYNWQAIRNNSKVLVGPLLGVVRLLLDRVNRSSVLYIVSLCRYFHKIGKAQGTRGLAIFLKKANTDFMRYLAGMKKTSQKGLRIYSNKSGLPYFIPPLIRKRIREGDIKVIKLTLTLFSLYRVLDFQGQFSLKTITDPGKSFDLNSYRSFVPTFLMIVGPFEIAEFKLFITTKSGPGCEQDKSKDKSKPSFMRGQKTSLGASLIQLLGLYQYDNLWKSLQIILRYTALSHESGRAAGGKLDFHEQVSGLWTVLKLLEDWFVVIGWKIPSYLGKLGFKQEPGKVRVFAIVDYWTQIALAPLHKGLFNLLSKLPTDATFDQSKAVDRLIDLSRTYRSIWSFDLSAATDRLPVSLQQLLIEFMVDERFAKHWYDLLVNREFVWAYGTPPNRENGVVRYSVGQPIGALSSWAMLALTHHFIVQLAAHRAGYKDFFELYAVLGDDLVILDGRVADQYLVIMKDLGVGISGSKSVISTNGSFEFAKRFIYNSVDVSPISLKEISVASGSLLCLTELLRRHNLEPRLSSIIGFLGKGYRVQALINSLLERMSRSSALLIVYLTEPGRTSKSFTNYGDWFSMIGVGRTSQSDLFPIMYKLVSYLTSLYKLSPMQDYNILQPFGLDYLDEYLLNKPDGSRLSRRLIRRLNDIFGPLLNKMQGESLRARLNEYRVKLTAFPLSYEGIEILVALIKNFEPMNGFQGLHSDRTVNGEWVLRPTSNVRISMGSWLRLWARDSNKIKKSIKGKPDKSRKRSS